MKTKIDGIAIGEQLRQEMTDTWLKSALACFELADDKDAMKEFKAAFGRNPKHIIKAVERFPQVYDADQHPDLFDILATIALSKVKDDDQAEWMYDYYNKNKDYDALKDYIKEYFAQGRKPRKTATCDKCERVRHLMESWDEMDSVNPQWNAGQQQCANELRDALALREGANAA